MPAPSLVPCVVVGAVAGEVSFLSAIEAWSPSSWSVHLILRSIGVSYFHEAGVGLVWLVGASLAIGPGVVEVHWNCHIVHVSRGIGRVISLVRVPLGIPVVARGVLLKVLAGSVVKLAVLEELVGRLASPSSQGLEDLFCFGHVDRRVSVQAIGRVGDWVALRTLSRTV